MTADGPSPDGDTAGSSRRDIRTQLRQPRLAELIANELRQRILNGEHRHGELLPKQEDLLEEFNVSKPSVREALRILETEGLIQVRRGSRGGATVQLPQSRDAAYMLGLVLQSKGVGFDDVATALQRLEPTCAAMCADRPDHADVARALREVHHRATEAVDDELEFVEQMRIFHESLVAFCGNETMKAVVGSLAELWSAKERQWAHGVANTSKYPGPELRQAGLGAHERIIGLIEAGEGHDVSRVAWKHLCATQIYALSASHDTRVDAAGLRSF